jgi:hypothetical protein
MISDAASDTLALICKVVKIDVVELWIYKNKEYRCPRICFSEAIKLLVKTESGTDLSITADALPWREHSSLVIILTHKY